MPEEQVIKIVPPKSAQQAAAASSKCANYVPWLIVLVGVYFVLVLLISFLTMAGYLKVLSLILGAFLILDVHHSIKYHVKPRD
jgi:hypothetical protein